MIEKYGLGKSLAKRSRVFVEMYRIVIRNSLIINNKSIDLVQNKLSDIVLLILSMNNRY